MSSDYTGTPGAITITVPLLDDGDRPSAQLWRQSFELIIDSLAEIADSLGGGGAPGSAFTTAGGTKVLAAPLEVQGADWRVANDIEVLATGNINVNSGGEINVDVGAQIDVAGTLNVTSTGVVALTSGAQLNGFVTANLAFETATELLFASGSSIAFASGSDVSGTTEANLIFSAATELLFTTGSSVTHEGGATLAFADMADLAIDDDSTTFEVALSPIAVQGNAALGTEFWEFQAASHWEQIDVGSNREMVFPLRVNAGDTITAITVHVRGGYGAGHSLLPAGADRLSVSVFVVDPVTGDASLQAQKFDASGSVGVYDAAHTITLTNGSLDSGTMPFVAGPLYYIVIAGETGANAIASTTGVFRINGVCTARSYRAQGQVY